MVGLTIAADASIGSPDAQPTQQMRAFLLLAGLTGCVNRKITAGRCPHELRVPQLGAYSP
jgi:hypothetical protein